LLFTTLSQDGKISDPASDRVIEFLASIKAWMAAETRPSLEKESPHWTLLGGAKNFIISKLSFFYFTR
jgi:hypothetical protein